ncbi:hypothetical protein EJ05DRAFT_503680 [Pseudovirgaria hyperparasitica]|uniref:Uncharacterized protein n=1 Tax=Pseudovirgaria hyperparasitica TaxID=470096 RepID=A0A6A6VYE1_9PEZI|nr:uncharacterized protein EJ05DRAFT_503680 [Pseudovirgaria hyperparasitica]KAF2754734.1 hypothetical protein EJ05DRAFT_503680 [Pseudovirgaria hyperparasitica]
MLYILQAIATLIAVFAVSIMSQFPPPEDPSVATQFIQDLDALISKTATQQASADAITFLDGPALFTDRGHLYDTLEAFESLVASMDIYTSQIRDAPPLPTGTNSDTVTTRYRIYMSNQGRVMATLNRHAGLFRAIRLGGRVVSGLESFRRSVINFESAVLVFNPTRAEETHAFTLDMIDRLNGAVLAYGGAVGRVRRRALAG